MISRKYDGKSNVIGNKIKNLRESLNLSQAELSNKREFDSFEIKKSLKAL